MSKEKAMSKYNSKHVDMFNKSRMFLSINGYLSDAENKKVKERFEKSAKKSGVDLEQVSVFSK